MSSEKRAYVLRSLIGVILALIVFLLVWFIGNAASLVLDTVRGNRNSIQDFAREIVIPAAGAFAGMMSVDKFIKKYNKHIVFYSF